jgi:eukaryotic-like serine/threonine-protein kinase
MMIGSTISHYRILQKIGAGGMGEVYLAEDTKLERQVALKFLPAQFSADEEEKKRFIHEAKAASALDHPNICSVHEIGETPEGQLFIVMGYYEGKTLKEKIKAGPLPVNEAVAISIQIAEGLKKAHGKGIVHRDLKPANIMLTDEGTAKIVDFGLAKLKGLTRLTKSGTTLGTVAYMSPEQALGKEVDQRSDIWSLGVILYEMLTGKLPFPGEYDQAVLYAVINEEPEPVTGLRSGVPIEFDRILAKALAKDPEERYQHADELLADLRHENKSLEYAKAGKVRQDKAAPKPGRRTLFLAAAAVVVLAIFFFLFSPFKLRIGQRQSVQAAVNSLAIMYFENMQDPTDKSRIAQMITALLTTGLSDAPRNLQVVSSQRLYDILKLLGKGDLRVVDRSVASDVARKAGVRWMVTGKILKEEPNIALISEISDVDSGKIFTTQRVNGKAGEDLFALVDRLSPQVIQALTLPEQTKKGLAKPVADLTTHSQEAYRSYIEGLDFFYKAYLPEADRSFMKTLKYDPTFAMAYYWLGVREFYSYKSIESQKAKENITQALKHSARLTQKEKLYIKSLAAAIAGNIDQSILGLQKVLGENPNEKEACLLLSLINARYLRKFDKAIRYLQQALAIDPLYKFAYNLLAYYYSEIGDFEKSLMAVNQYTTMAPGEANPYDTRGDLYAWNGKIDQAINSYKKALEIKPDFTTPMMNLGTMYLFKKEYAKAEACFKELTISNDQSGPWHATGRHCLALLLAYKGKLKEAQIVLDKDIAADGLERFSWHEGVNKHISKANIHEEQGNLGLAIKEVESGLKKNEKDDAWARWLYRDHYALLLAKSGKMTEAEAIVQTLKKESEEDKRAVYTYWRAAGAIALAKNDLKSAQYDLEMGEADTFWGNYLLASTYLQLGLLDKAAAILEKAISRYDRARALNPILAVKVYYLLGLTYEKSGWKDKAIENFKEFLDIWKNADAGLPEVEDARQRLEKLKKL